jgi:hypothetical protein
MKKTLAIIALSAVTLASFGQGYFSLQLGSKSVWNGFTTPGVDVLGATMDVGLYIGAAGQTPGVGSVGIATNGANASLVTPTSWSTVLNDPNFALAVNGNTSNPLILANNANGSVTLTGTFPIVGTVAGNTYSIYFVAWSNAYATPALAAAANTAIGWSSVFQYTSVSSIGTPATMAASGFLPFSVAGVPEPSTMALAALGGASLLLFRRRK